MFLEWLKICNDDINVKHVMELKAMKYLRALLIPINLWPRRELGEYEPRRPYTTYIHLSHGIICWFAGFLHIVNNFHELSLFEMGHSYITSMLYVVFLSRLPLALFKKYKEVSTEFVLKIHLFHIKHRSPYAMEVHIAVNKVCYILLMYTLTAIVFGTSLFNIQPIVHNYISGMYSYDETLNITKKYKHAVYYALPFDADTSLRGYIIVNIYNCGATVPRGSAIMQLICRIVSVYTIDAVVFIDLFMCIMVLHLWGRFKILIHELDTFPRPGVSNNEPGKSNQNQDYRAEVFSQAELSVVHEKLKECISSHFELLTFVDNMSTVFGPILFVYNTFHLVACCLLLVECSQMNTEAFALYGTMTFILFQHLIELSCVFELLGSVSEKVKDAVYCLPWECMDKRNRLTVMIFLMKVQEPVRVKALGMINIGVTNMAMILKTSFSYFTFLRTVAE